MVQWWLFARSSDTEGIQELYLKLELIIRLLVRCSIGDIPVNVQKHGGGFYEMLDFFCICGCCRDWLRF